MQDQLYFYSKSKDALPGAGTNEHVNNNTEYKPLTLVPHWRHILSNFHVATCPIEYEGLRYKTIEHVFQAAKTRLKDVDKAYHFSIESGDDIGQGNGQVAQQHRKYVKLNKDECDQWSKMSDQVMKAAALSLYGNEGNARERAVLVATRDAQLWHIQSRKSPVRFIHLEEIRDNL
jgi:predicted NAD-dependent protein-ADP-ribosyltransferase YbiA (DUF1768 family)